MAMQSSNPSDNRPPPKVPATISHDSALLRLPNELRLQIYELALAHCFCRKNAYLAHVAPFFGHIHTPLLLVNGQIYAESR
ncbi:hypothetical protein MMC08_005428, partial [Hypocenomyce scalaris]|nr:hypothetical protein [Hypocenomyce scalaris]